MRTRIILGAAALVLSSCAIPAQVALNGDGEPQPTTTVDDRVPGGWYLYDRDMPGDCNGLYGDVVIPCRDILNVCGPTETGVMLSTWLPEVFRCTGDSPTRADVCATIPDEQLPFYGITREDCPT